MKRTRFFLFSVVTVSVAFTSLVYTSCKKDRCAGVTCSYNGTCSNGTCTCSAGWTGNNCEQKSKTEIKYTNNTYIPVYVNSGVGRDTIKPGTSITYSGYNGDHMVGSAYTLGSLYVGETVSWDLSSDQFPVTGTLTRNLDAPNTYYFLRIQNNSSYEIHDLIVNGGTPAGTIEYVSLLYGTYDIGYYLAPSSPGIMQLVSLYGFKSWNDTCRLPGVPNQIYTYIVH